MTYDEDRIAEWNGLLREAGPQEVLAWAAGAFPDRIALATSFGVEDQVLTDMIVGQRLPIRLFTLDTGRLFPETLDLIALTVLTYGVQIEVFAPDASDVESMVRAHGIDLFRDSVAARKRCCEVRKLRPLRRAQEGLDAWICGLRRGQGVTREAVSTVELDPGSGLVKINPLANWDEGTVWAYAHGHQVPYNPLHDVGMPSIGCAPCTRAIEPGEDVRAGRWWWEDAEHRECGLHGAGSSEPLRSLSSPPLAAAEAPCGVPATRPDDEGDLR